MFSQFKEYLIMIKIIKGSEVSSLDSFYVTHQGISSFELMERAAHSFVNWFMEQSISKGTRIAIFFGPGNNGGDGLAIGRLLHKQGYSIHLFSCFESNSRLSPDCQRNLELIPFGILSSSWKEFNKEDFDLVIDAFLGVGVKGELRESAQKIISRINSFQGKKIAVDLPSGLPADMSCAWECVQVDFTITFGFPKLSLLLPENAKYSGEMVVVDIGIPASYYEQFNSDFYFLRETDLFAFHKTFHRFSHKGDFGKVLLIAGSKGKMGAAILSSKSALRTGSGLVTCLIPELERSSFHSSVPEAMAVFYDSEINFPSFDSMGIGPGLGLDKEYLLERVFDNFPRPMVIDADALTILSRNPYLTSKIPKGSILTPHLGEFERLFGKHETHLDRLKTARDFCTRYQLNLVLKGANTVISLSDGRQIFNSSGCKHMATAGVGDVLTGMLTSFLGQGYSPESAMICGVFQHGLAGELAGREFSRSMMASDLTDQIPASFKKMGVE